MPYRTALLVGATLALAGCPKAPPATDPIDNATTVEGAGACPELEVGASDPGEDCVRGELVPALDAPAEAPSCHRVARASATSGFEQIVLADHGTVVLEHGGCAHWSLVIRFDARGASGTADVHAYAARVLRALPAPADDHRFDALADAIDGAADVELGQSITITDSFEYLDVSVEGDQIVVVDDVAL